MGGMLSDMRSPGLIVAFPIACALAAAGGFGCAKPGPPSPSPAPTSAPAESDGTPNASPAAEDPAAPPAPPARARPVRVIVGGDLLPHRPSLIAPAAIEAALAPLGPLFAQADSVVGNYEAATGDVDAKSPRLAYAAPTGWMAGLPKAGIRAVSVANNHACDLGEAGLTATLDETKKNNLLALGGDAEDPWTPRVLVDRDGKRVCAVAWTTISNTEGQCAKGRHVAVAPLNGIGKQRIDRALQRAKEQHCDATVAVMHGGVEYVPQTTQMMDQAGHAAEAGADAIVIHHPHIASPVVIHPTKTGKVVPVFASVGNLVTNQGESWKPPMFPVLTSNRRLVCVNGWTRLGVLADLTFSFDGPSPRLDWGTHLLWIENEHAENKNATTPKITARLLDPIKDKAIVDTLRTDRRGPVALFSDPCWLEQNARGDSPTPNPACTTASGGRAIEASVSSATARRAKKRASSRGSSHAK